MTASVLHVDHVDVVRDARPILADVSWEVRAGERWTVLGPNGAGKSTLLRLASTYQLPTRGRVHVLGRRVGGVDLRTVRPLIGYVSASHGRAVAPGSTTLDAVITGVDASLRRWRQEYRPGDWTRARTLLADVGCEHLAGAAFDTLSDGERLRVQLARALMPQPRLLLLDEPAASLDLAGREQLLAALERFAGDPSLPGLVLVTHHVEEVPRATTHALLLRHGRVVVSGPVDEVLDDGPLSACFGVPVQVHRRDGRYHAVAGDRATV